MLENRDSNWDPACLRELGSLPSQLALGMTGRAPYPRIFCVLRVSHGQTTFFTLSNTLGGAQVALPGVPEPDVTVSETEATNGMHRALSQAKSVSAA
jgi:hypothetical protein